MKYEDLTLDKYGFIGHQQSPDFVEGGDSVNYMGHYIYLSDDRDKLPLVENYEVKFGAWVRHPHADQTNNGFGAHYKNPWNGCISRDQYTGILAAMIAKQDRWALCRALLHHSTRLFCFTYNTIHNGDSPDGYKFNLIKLFYNPNREDHYYKLPDLSLFDIWAMYIRGMGKLGWLLWPVLCVLDLHMLLNTLYFNYISEDTDVISFAMKSIVQREHMPTPVSMLSWKLLDAKKLLTFINHYWCSNVRGGNCEMYGLYEKKLKELGK